MEWSRTDLMEWSRTDLMEWSRYDGVVKYWWSGLGAPQVIREVVRPGIVVTDS